MAATSHILINDFVGLPIIISDFDALPSSSSNNNSNTPSQPSQSPTPTSTTSPQSSTAAAISQAYSDTTNSALQQNWTTGFSDFADEMWAKMTQGMKQKLREACVEVLRKTEGADGSSEAEGMGWQYDDDARFLD